jgi:farnesyl-diphosphate farnesyltransferase
MVTISSLLEQTSRTFGLAIPLLGEPLRQQVSIAYLLFRVADTFEDAKNWPKHRRIEALESFRQVLNSGTEADVQSLSASWTAPAPVDHRGYLTLLREFPLVIAEYERLAGPVRKTIRDHCLRTIEGMVRFVSRHDDQAGLRLTAVQDLRDYCYTVAGIVGEMLTELFVLQCPSLASVRPELARRAAAFGEGLQLVNILKDAEADAGEKRFLIPTQVPITELFEMARADLQAAEEYVEVLRCARASDGIVNFTALPVALAHAALACIEASGFGAKLGRADVARIGQGISAAVAKGQPIRPREVALTRTED